MLSKLLVIAGAGTYPELIVRGAKKAGVAQVDVMGVKGSTSRATVRAADRVVWFSLGEIISAVKWTATQGYDGAILAGQVNPLSLFRGRFEDAIKEVLRAMPVKNAHSLFRKLIELFEKAGVRMLPASLYMDDNLPGVGPLTTRGFTAEEETSMGHARQIARDMGAHDVGQTVIVKAGMVLAVEAFEGTNAAIRRAGRLSRGGSVLFKAARVGHDMRFDIPVVGLKTLKTMKKAGVTALGFQAGRLVLLDREAVVAYANKHNIALVGLESGLPPAPLRP